VVAIIIASVVAALTMTVRFAMGPRSSAHHIAVIATEGFGRLAELARGPLWASQRTQTFGRVPRGHSPEVRRIPAMEIRYGPSQAAAGRIAAALYRSTR
jgi:hypothetical protein